MPDPKTPTAAVLAEYRRERAYYRPLPAACAARDRVACRIARAVVYDVQPPAEDVEEFKAACELVLQIDKRVTAESARRGVDRFESFWHHGRVTA
jgi:hypothetical protein